MDAKERAGTNSLAGPLSELGVAEASSLEYRRLRKLLRMRLEGTPSIVLDSTGDDHPIIPDNALLALLEELKEAEESRIQTLHLHLPFHFPPTDSEQDVIHMIVTVLRTGHLSSLRHLSLGRCATTAIFQAMQSGRVVKLRHLDISELSSSREEAEDSKGRRSFFGSGMLSEVVHLRISSQSDSVNSGDIKALVEAIESNGGCKLKHFDLPYNSLGDEGCEGMARLFKLGYLPCLEYLCLAYCKITQRGMAAITEAIIEGPNAGLRFQHLDLSGNDLGDCRELVTLFRAGYLSNLKEFSVADCGIGDQGARAIFKAIMEVPPCPMKIMDISTDDIHHEGVLEFLKSGHLPELQYFHCRWSMSGVHGIYEEGLMAFARFLEDGLYVGGLTSISLDGVEAVSAEVAGAFVSAYANNEALTLRLRLHWPDISYENNAKKYRERNIVLTSARSDLRNEEKIPATTGKVFLCGFPMVGKTTLRKSLQKTGISRWSLEVQK